MTQDPRIDRMEGVLERIIADQAEYRQDMREMRAEFHRETQQLRAERCGPSSRRRPSRCGPNSAKKYKRSASKFVLGSTRS